MRESLLRVIDDFETKRDLIKEVQASTKTVIGHSMAEGMLEIYNYAIQELKKVLSDA